MGTTETTDDFFDEIESNIKDALGGLKKKKSWEDERFWKIQKNPETNKGVAVIKLLVDKNKQWFTSYIETSKFVFDKELQKKVWLIANFRMKDASKNPINEYFTKLYNGGTKEGQKVAVDYFGRSEKYISNVYVITDPANHENDGKVFLWKFGTKLMDKISTAMTISEEEKALGEVAKQVSNPLTEWVIKLKFEEGTGGIFNYDNSEIISITSVPAYKDMKMIKQNKAEIKDLIFNETYTLEEYENADENWTPFDEVRETLKRYVPSVSKKIGMTISLDEDKNDESKESGELDKNPEIKPDENAKPTETNSTPSPETAETVSPETAETGSTATEDDDSWLDD